MRRWGGLFPPRDKSRQPLPVSEDWVQVRLKDVEWVATTRERLQSISWFMKCLKEPLSRLANREDKARGAFFERRFKSVAILDDERLAICAYIDLNPVAAGIAEIPEASEYTSIKARAEHVEARGEAAKLEAATGGSVAGSRASAGVEESLWLSPIEDRRELDSSREGMFVGFSLGSYLLLVDYTGRLFREGKTAISADLAGIFERLGTNAESWQLRLEKLRTGQLFGRFFAASRARLRKWPNAWACDTWPTWPDVRPNDSIRVVDRIEPSSQPSPLFPPTRKPSAPFADHSSLNSSRWGGCYVFAVPRRDPADSRYWPCTKVRSFRRSHRST